MVDSVRGIRVLDGEDANKYLEIINIFHNVAQKYDCRYIKLPTIEKDELFTRTVGENTDIVTKQMFSFADKNVKEENLHCLGQRPLQGWRGLHTPPFDDDDGDIYIYKYFSPHHCAHQS